MQIIKEQEEYIKDLAEDNLDVLDFISSIPNIDTVQAIYWWLNDHHLGQSSKRYKDLSMISRYYRPGYLERGPKDEAKEIYNQICELAGCKH